MRAAALVLRHCISPQSVVEEVWLEQRLTRLTRGRKGEIAAKILVAARAAAPALFGARLGCAFRCQIGAEETSSADHPISPLLTWFCLIISQLHLDHQSLIRAYFLHISCIYSCISLLP